MKSRTGDPTDAEVREIGILAGNQRAACDDRAYFQAAAERLAMLPDASEPDVPVLLLEQHYGQQGALTALSSEVERTFDARLADGRAFILKTSSRPQALESFQFQSAALAGLRGADGVMAPEVIDTLSGGLMFEHEGGCGYLQTRMDGIPLHMVPRTPEILREVGAALARLNLAMKDTDPPAARRPVLWNIACWPWLVELERYLSKGRTAKLVRSAMAEYIRDISPHIADLDWQVTHNDPSPFNMIDTGKGIGFIDFGDGGWNPRVQDLAIAAGHFVIDPRTPLGGAEHVIAGYASLAPLSELEASLLLGLMRARQSALVLINNWRSHLFPAAAPYIMKNVKRAEQGLAVLALLDVSSGEAAIRAAAGLDPP
ncbi:phosphotransferase [Novosphingobium sp. PY1]|uniref:phosphotransferase n=1 Tax=Novosphingobium sp. PY1 TaxID=1882221 RepID=UPI001F5CFE77|nr:phosphotransferase [Novosphingobium sp. PY1]